MSDNKGSKFAETINFLLAIGEQLLDPRGNRVVGAFKTLLPDNETLTQIIIITGYETNQGNIIYRLDSTFQNYVRDSSENQYFSNGTIKTKNEISMQAAFRTIEPVIESIPKINFWYLLKNSFSALKSK